MFEEGCLSVPEIWEDVERPARIKAEYLDRDGKEQVLEADGMLATCLQHEMDHLEGVLFIDHLSKLKRSIALRKLQKAKRLKETGDARATPVIPEAAGRGCQGPTGKRRTGSPLRNLSLLAGMTV